jgi:hypothetical protein
MTPQPLLERLITRYPRYCNFMGYISNSSIKPGKLADQLVKYSYANRLARDP